MLKVKIIVIGIYVLSRCLINVDLEKIVDMLDEWIVQCIGMRECWIVDEQQFIFDLCIEVVKDFKSCYEGIFDNVDMIFVVIIIFDYVFLSMVCCVQEYFGWESIGVLDINVMCVGLIYGFYLVNGLIIFGFY